MVRTVNQKSVRSLAKGESAVLLPGSTGAEPWELWTMGGKPTAELTQVYRTPLENRLRKISTLALPVSEVYCLPLWLNETEPKQFAAMISLQVELRGLQPRGADPAVFDWTVVNKEAARTLVMVGVLPAALAAELQAEGYELFDLSARYYAFPENTLTIWREQDRLAFAITRGANLIYFQILPEGQITSRVVQDLVCAQATLAMQDILGPITRLLVWTEITPPEIAALQAALPLPLEQAERPSPVEPRPAWKLTPSSVGEAKRVRASRQWQRRLMALLAIVYLIFVGLLIYRYVTTQMEITALNKWKSSHAQDLQTVQDGRDIWKDLQPVVDVKDYPLELLLEACKAMSTDQLHLTLFKTGSGHLLIEGEANNVSAAFDFYNKLKADPYFSSYSLQMANPHPLPNDLTKFQIEGVHAGN